MKQFERVLALLQNSGDSAEEAESGQRVLRRAAWLARRVGAQLTILQSGPASARGDFDLPGGIPGMSDLGECLAGLSVEEVTLRGSPWRTTIREVMSRDIDLVVASKRSHRRPDAGRIGRVARHLVRQCPCAVWLEDARLAPDPTVIVAATDLTPVGHRVVELAASVAAGLGSRLHVVHAFSTSLEAQVRGGAARVEHEKACCERATETLTRQLSETPLGRRARIHVGRTSPTRAVLDCVSKFQPGLLVMGTVSRGGVADLLMGSTAEKLIDRVDCALLTIKPHDFVCPVEPEA